MADKATAPNSTAFHPMLDAAMLDAAKRRADLPEGIRALKRLLKVAQGHSGQCRYVAGFLLGLYNGTRFKFDLTDFRCLDRALFDDCLTVLRMDWQPAREVHCYFEDGGAIWEQLAQDWNIRDYTQDKA